MTTGDYHSNYLPVGIIEANCYDGYKLKDGVEVPQSDINQKERDDLYNSSTSLNINDYNYKKCTIYDLLDNMFLDAKKKGANGVIKIEIQPIKSNEQSGIRIIGMAIKY